MRYEDVGEDLRPLIFEFFFWFSKFESALKENRWLQFKSVGAAARPDWSGFVKKFEHTYTPSEAAIRLVEANPQKQIVTEHGLDFTEVTFANDVPQLERVAVLLKTVRNNLFHGGKHGSAYWDDRARMNLLLPLCVTLLAELADLGGLQTDYVGYY